ncbi:MAG: SIMPL domain-containing protein [Thermomicrobiales bacterium]|nr:SIMPL domain-containing protein [Thermomicrobiales bacterium]
MGERADVLERHERRTVRVRGEGIVEVAPDAATLVGGVFVSKANLKKARDEAAAKATAIIAAARESGVARRDIQTGRYAVYPRQEVDGKGRPVSSITYEVSNRITVAVRDLERLPDLLDAMTASGANQVDGPIFFLQHPEEAEDEARRRAMATARRRAEVLAAAAGSTLGTILTIAESGASSGVRLAERSVRFSLDAPAATPIEAGTERIVASIEVTWELV